MVGIRSFNHQLNTVKQNKIALTYFYDKMQMTDKINCVPCGYNPSNIIPEEVNTHTKEDSSVDDITELDDLMLSLFVNSSRKKRESNKYF